MRALKNNPKCSIAVWEFKELTERMKHASEEIMPYVEDALRKARYDTRDFVNRTHPSPAFGGQDLHRYGSGRTSMFRLGHFGWIGKAGGYKGHKNFGTISSLNIYANYLARWYNTGATQHASIRTAKGQQKRTTFYPARGNYFEANKDAICEYFANIVNKELDELNL